MHLLKFISIILLFSTLFSCTNKYYLGTYEYSYLGTLANTSQLYLKKDQSFTFDHFDDMSTTKSVKGFGKYTISNDSIYLEYSGAPDSVVAQIQKRSILRYDTYPKKNDSYVNIRLKVIEIIGLDTMSIIGISISGLTLTKQNYDNLDGVINIQVDPSQFPCHFYLNSIGFESPKLSFTDANKDYDLIVQLHQISSNSIGWISGNQKFAIKKNEDKIKISNMTKTKK